MRSLSRFAAAPADRNWLLVASQSWYYEITFRFFNLDIVVVLRSIKVTMRSMTSLNVKIYQLWPIESLLA